MVTRVTHHPENRSGALVSRSLGYYIAVSEGCDVDADFMSPIDQTGFV